MIRAHLDSSLIVPLSDGGSTVELVFGNCLKLVQCNGRGHEILSREHSLEFGGTRVVKDSSSSSSSRRTMMKVIPKTDDGHHLLQYPPEFNPHLQQKLCFLPRLSMWTVQLHWE